MINRKEMIEEELLRENIRKAIQIIKEKNDKKENYIRTIVRSLLKEEAVIRYERDSLVQLYNLMSSVFGSTDTKKAKKKFPFKESFIDLVSSEQDREIFVNFILDFSNKTMSDIDSSKELDKLGKEEEAHQEEEILPDDEDDDDIIRVSIDDIPGGDLEADIPEEKEEEVFSLGEDAEDIEEEEEHPELKSYAEKAYAPLGTALADYYDNYVNRLIEDEIFLDTTRNMFLPPSEKREEVFEAGTLTEKDLFKIFYRINVLSWAGRYNNEYFNENPITKAKIVSPGEEDLGMEDAPEPEIPGEEFKF